MAKKYIKKPIVIKAEQWTGNLTVMEKFMGSKPFTEDGKLYIETLEGTMEAKIGDFIIRGKHGEYYPCKPDIFKETYEEVIE